MKATTSQVEAVTHDIEEDEENFQCDFGCGFEATFDAVEEHEGPREPRR